ncbi:MAG: T9SS type A sorting domain-containing protein [Saprospiraceae bacterium]
MKQLLTILCIALVGQKLSSQVFLPVIINGEVFFKTEMETAEGLISAEVTVANFEKIDGQLYNRVFIKKHFDPDLFVGHLREDAATGQIYFRNLTTATDVLVYDISLAVGDTLTLQARWCDNLPGDEAIATAVTWENGLKKITFNRSVGYQQICEPLVFLEGVGPNASLIFPYFRNAIPENGVAQRLCHASREAVVFYPANSNTDLCGLDITSTEEPSTMDVRIYPNPFHDQLFVAGLPAGTTVQLFNLQGRLLMEAKDTLPTTDGLRPGMYLLKLIGSDGRSFTTKIVKSY